MPYTPKVVLKGKQCRLVCPHCQVLTLIQITRFAMPKEHLQILMLDERDEYLFGAVTSKSVLVVDRNSRLLPAHEP
jgi:hypothetical protein